MVSIRKTAVIVRLRQRRNAAFLPAKSIGARASGGSMYLIAACGQSAIMRYTSRTLCCALVLLLLLSYLQGKDPISKNNNSKVSRNACDEHEHDVLAGIDGRRKLESGQMRF
jgi:hypothetical protein